MPTFKIATTDEVRLIAEALVTSCHTPNLQHGCVTADQVRARLVRATKQLVNGASVANELRNLYGPSNQGLFKVTL